MSIFDSHLFSLPVIFDSFSTVKAVLQNRHFLKRVQTEFYEVPEIENLQISFIVLNFTRNQSN